MKRQILVLLSTALVPFQETRAEEILRTPHLSCEVANTIGSTILTTKVKGSESPVKFRIDWFTGDETSENFRTSATKERSLTSTHLLGKTTLTRTILASAGADCILIHVHADQPGPVHFTTRFVSEKPAKIRNRREIILSDGEIHAHAWVVPFESDVSDDGKAITVAGEGEALIILNLTDNAETRPISNTLDRLGEKHDPGHTPPNPHLIWEAVKKL